MPPNAMISASPRDHAITSLRGLIERSGLRPGERLPAESKLAAQLEVSRMTIRKALDALEREGLVRRERNLGCVCATQTKTSSGLLSRTVVLVTDHAPAVDTQDFGGNSPAIVSGVMAHVNQHRYDFLRVAPSMTDGLWLNELISAGTPGVIVSCWKRPIDWQVQVLNRLATAGLPVVTFGESEEFAPFDRVMSDHVSGAEKLVHALAETGSKHILRLWTTDGEKPWIKAHDQGYDRAIRARGLESLKPVYVESLPERDKQSEANFKTRVRFIAGYLAEHLSGNKPVDAIMAATDCDALVILAACRLFGRTDIRVTGYDNYWSTAPERQWEPGIPFATVDKNNHALGEALAQLLLQRITGELKNGPHQELAEQVLVLSK